MANNFLYIVDPISTKKVLIAKGWEYGWEVHHPEVLAEKLQDMFNEIRDNGRELGSLEEDGTQLELWTEDTTRSPI
jgi:hypothetical protein